MRIAIVAGTVVAALALSACGAGGGAGTTAGARTAAATGARSATVAGATSASPAGSTATAAGSGTAGTADAAGTGTAGSGAAGTAGGGTAGTADSGGASVGGPGRQCTAAGLALSFLGGQGATGHGELGFALRNTGAACSIGGYPGIQFLDQSGAALPTTPSHTTSDFFGHLPLQELTLQPGQSVSFRLGVSHGGGSGGAGAGGGCTTAYGLQVIAPNDTATLRVQIPNGASECGTTTVSPVQVGDSAYQ
jgi:hypothetical protein